MQRRVFPASTCGTVAALTGCLGTRSSGSGGSERTAESTPAATPTRTRTGERTPAADVTVDAVRLQYGVVTQSSPDSIGVSDANTPYLVAPVSVDGPLSWKQFGLDEAEV